jgi:predicted nucleotidyltransferase
MAASIQLVEQPEVPAIIGYLETQPAVLAAVVFGSAAAGRLHPESDLDLALLFADDDVPNDVAALDIRAALEQHTRRDIDLIVLNPAPTILAIQVAKKGRLIFCRDSHAYQCYVVHLISEYADFKIIRRPIEEAVLKRRIYD